MGYRPDFELEESQSETPIATTLPPPYDEIWQSNPVSIEQFIREEPYLGLGYRVYKNILRLAREWERPDIREGWAVLGKGSGKSFLASVMMVRGVYKLLCYRDYREYFKLPIGKTVVINLSTSIPQAEHVIFANFKSLIKRSQWFKDSNYQLKKREIEFPRDIMAVSGHSGSTAWVGYNVYVGVLDEADFLMDNKDRAVAQELYEVMLASGRTRFPDHYKIFIITSLFGYRSFAHRKLEEMQQVGKRKPSIIEPKGRRYGKSTNMQQRREGEQT